MDKPNKDLVAVITAAIMATMDRKTKIVVKSIKRTTNNSANNWAFADRQKSTWQ